MGTTYSRGNTNDVSNIIENFETVEPNFFDVSKDVECDRDWTFTADTGVLTSTTSLRMNMPRKYEVDIQHSSISYAIAYLLSYESVTLFRPSVQFIDQTMKYLCVGNARVSSRMTIKAVQKFGVCEENEYSESPDDSTFPSEECCLKAQNFNRIEYYKVRFETIKKALCIGYPVVVCVEIFNNDQIREDVIYEPKHKSTSLGNIASLVTGYDDKSNSFEYMNCVNSEWGNCDYSIVNKYGHSMWILKDSKYEDLFHEN